MEKVGLVLEGGGMRGLYTAGVLECFLERGLYFNYVVGVSAGACNAASYISRQKGRNKIVNTRFVKDWRYLSLRNLLLKKSAFGMDFIFDEIPNKLVPFDFETFYKENCDFYVGATDCRTGKAVYFSKDEMKKDFDALRASSSIPLLSPIVHINSMELLDGGVADPIPIRKSLQDGNRKNVIVLTRNRDYSKKPVRFYRLFQSKYRKYPELLNAIRNRHVVYNETLRFIEALERDGSAIVIRPSKPLQVDRLEKNPEKLLELYDNGYQDTEELLERINTFSTATNR